MTTDAVLLRETLDYATRLGLDITGGLREDTDPTGKPRVQVGQGADVAEGVAGHPRVAREVLHRTLRAKALAYTCRECGGPGDGFGYYGGEAMIAARLCFGCNHWTKLLPAVTTSVRVGGKHYQMGAETAHRDDKGFGGQRFVVVFTDGRPQRLTTNLWHQGEIPAHFRDRLPDNARFDHDTANELGRVLAYANAVKRWDELRRFPHTRQIGPVAHAPAWWVELARGPRTAVHPPIGRFGAPNL